MYDELLLQIELVDNPLHVSLRGLTQAGRSAAGHAVLGQFRKAEGAHLVALDRHHFHALVDAIALKHRQGQRQHGRKSCNGREHGCQKLRAGQHVNYVLHRSLASVVAGSICCWLPPSKNQNLKLIILRITKTPHIIHDSPTTMKMLPVWVLKSGMM